MVRDCRSYEYVRQVVLAILLVSWRLYTRNGVPFYINGCSDRVHYRALAVQALLMRTNE